MNKFKILFYFLLFSFICIGCFQRGMDTSTISNKEKLELKIIASVLKKIEKEKKMSMCEIGSEKKEGYYIRSIGFKYYDRLTIDEMRELLIYIVKLFIENYNTSEELLSYVKTPYDVKNFEIAVYTYDKKGYDLPPSELSIGEIYNCQLIYKSVDVKNYKMEILYKETYEEALEKIEKR